MLERPFQVLNFKQSLKAVEQLKNICPNGFTLAQFALKWILMSKAVTCAIPGAKNERQVEENALVSDMKNLEEQTMSGVNKIYNKYIKEQVHNRW